MARQVARTSGNRKRRLSRRKRTFPMLDRVHQAEGEIFTSVEAYVNDVDRLWSRIDRFDKLERLQDFRQPDDESWRAFAAGHWGESLELTARNRRNVVAEFEEDARLGYRSYRVRVVEFPIHPYLQWEMHRLKIRAECGENIRIIGRERVARFERARVVPELIFMGSLAMYEIRYDENGVLAGARKLTDPELIAGCRAEVLALYERGEPFGEFFDRVIATLPEPELSPSARS